MFAVVASTMTKLTVAAPTPQQAHADPRVHMEKPAAPNDVEATLREADALNAARERASDDEMGNTDIFDELEEQG